MDQELYTFEEIVSELKISKSTASVAIKNLLIRDAIEYITLPGDRKRYFRTKISNKDIGIKDFITWLKRFKEITVEAIDLKEDKESRMSKFYENIIARLNLYIPKMEKLNDELEK